MDKAESKENNNQLFKWIQKNKKPLIIFTSVVGLIIINHYYHKSSLSQKFNEYDFLRKGPIGKVNDYREKIRILHSKGETGMWDKLTWIDKVIYNRPGNMPNKNIPLNLPKREHGWYL